MDINTPIRDRPFGRRRLVDGAAASAAIAGPADTDDTQPCRNPIQHLRDRLADMMDGAAAIGTGFGIDVEMDVLTFEMIGQSGRFIRCLCSCRRNFRQTCLGTGDVGIDILQPKQHLVAVEAFGATTKPVALQQFEDMAQTVDLGVGLCPLVVARCNQIADQVMQRFDIIRQGGEIDLHGRILRL